MTIVLSLIQPTLTFLLSSVLYTSPQVSSPSVSGVALKDVHQLDDLDSGSNSVHLLPQIKRDASVTSQYEEGLDAGSMLCQSTLR